MRSLGSVILGVFVSLCLLSDSALALDIIYPADKSIIQKSNYLIIKGGNQPVLDALILEINGVASDPIVISDEEYKSAFADFLILEPDWSKGKNAIVVKGLVGDKIVTTVKADFIWSPLADVLSIVPAGYEPFVMHTAEKEALCAPCHNMQPTAAQLKSTSSEQNPCGSCHQRMFEQKFVHGPEGVFQCVDCHDSKGTTQRWQVTKPELALCGECHADKISEIKNRSFVHGPVAVGNCTICHNPHAGPEPAQLNDQVNLLCKGCHDGVKEGEHVVRGTRKGGHPLSGPKDPSNPEKKLSCVSCHNPHSSKSEQFFVRDITMRMRLCSECHKK